MATLTDALGTRTSLAFSGSSLSTLASATYVQNTTAYNCNTNKPQDVLVEVDVGTTNTPGSLKQVSVFIRESLDGSNYRSGPTSGTTATREGELRLLGVIPLTTASTTPVGIFSVRQALGYIPYDFFIVVKNETGVALTSGTVFTCDVTTTIA